MAASDLIRIFPSDAGAEEITESGIAIENLQATIDAIYTASALVTGTPLLPGQVETIVAETLSAMDAEAMASAITETPVVSLTATNEMAFSLTETAEHEPTATKTVQWVYQSPTPTRHVVKPPPATSTPKPTSIPIPASTSVPEEEKCKLKAHPNFPTCVPDL